MERRGLLPVRATAREFVTVLCEERLPGGAEMPCTHIVTSLPDMQSGGTDHAIASLNSADGYRTIALVFKCFNSVGAPDLVPQAYDEDPYG